MKNNRVKSLNKFNLGYELDLNVEQVVYFYTLSRNTKFENLKFITIDS